MLMLMESVALPAWSRAAWQSEPLGRQARPCHLWFQEQAKVFRHVLGGAVPLRRPLRECLLADPFQFLGDRVIDLAWRAGFRRGDQVQQLD